MHGYWGHLNIVVFVGLYILSSYAIGIDVLSMIADSFFLFLMNLYGINVFYQFK